MNIAVARSFVSKPGRVIAARLGSISLMLLLLAVLCIPGRLARLGKATSESIVGTVAGNTPITITSELGIDDRNEHTGSESFGRFSARRTLA
jgi:hypothetical protein